MTPAVRKLASRYFAAKAVHRLVARYFEAYPTKGSRLDPGTKKRINKTLNRLGLDGNGSFEKPVRGFSAAVDTLADFDIELEDFADGWRWGTQPTGQQNFRMAFSTADPFSPDPIINASLSMTWYQRTSGNFEVLAYVA